MIRDEDLKSSIDYSKGQKEAAHRIPDGLTGKDAIYDQGNCER